MAKEILGLGAKFFGRCVTIFFWEGCMAKYFGGRVAIHLGSGMAKHFWGEWQVFIGMR